MATPRTTESGTRARTRRAILNAAVDVLRKNPNAPLSDVAAAADVGRSTLHRYYPERSDLVAALGDHALDQLDAALIRARPTEGPADVALRRMSHECFEVGPAIALVYGDPQVLSNEAFWIRLNETDQPLIDLLERGFADGTFTATLSVGWVRRMLWWCLFTGWVTFDLDQCSRTEALEAIDETVARLTGTLH